MPEQTIEIVGRREMPGLDATNPRAISVVIFYRKVGDPASGDFVQLPAAKATDAGIQEAIAAKERAKGAGTSRRFTIS